MKRILALIACGAAGSAAFGEIYAEVGSPMGTVQISSSEVGEVTQDSDGDLRWTGSVSMPSMGWDLDWDFEVNGDPFVTGVAGFTNTLGGTSAFTFNISTTSTISIAAPIVNGASTITVLDTGSDGATMAAVAADSIYNAFIVGTSEQTLFNDPYSLVAPAAGINFDGTAWGPQPASGPINNGDLFGINHDFTLTAGDQATLNSSFFIVPEPATIGLLLVGGLLVTRRR